MSDEYERLLDEEIAKAEAECPVREDEDVVLCEMVDDGRHRCLLFSGLCPVCLKESEEAPIIPRCCNGKEWCTSLVCE